MIEPTEEELKYARELTDLFLFEIFVNIKAKNSGFTPKLFVEMESKKDFNIWLVHFKEMLEAGWLK